MLALSAPDSALGLSAEKTLQPTIMVRNTTARNVSANGTLSWRSDSRKGQVKLPELQLAPFATKQLQIWAMQKQLGIPADAHWALVSLTSNAAPDDLIAIASSRDCTGVYSAETKFVGGRGGRFAGGEWRTDAAHNHIAAITNVGSQATDALLTLHYNNGEKKYELQQSLAPGEQMWVNLEQLVRHRVADRSGNFLPVDVSAVTYDVHDLTPGGRSLIASDLAVDTAAGQAVPNCPYCCAYYDSPYFSPDPVQILLDGFQNLDIFGINGCNHQATLITGDFTVWGSNNTNIAKVTTANAQGVGVGSTIGFTQGKVLVPGECACNFALREVAVAIYVSPPSVTFGNTPVVPLLKPVPITATVTPSTNTAPITLTLSTTSGTGSATFANGSTTMTITTTTTAIIVGVSGSSVSDNIKLAAKIGSRELASTTFTVTAPVTGAIPVNFTQTVASVSGVTLHFEYRWGSSSGNLGDLSNCQVRETITFVGPNPYPWASPPYLPNQTVVWPDHGLTPGPATSGLLTDNHGHANGWLKPYAYNAATSNQVYEFSCTTYKPSQWTSLMPLSGTIPISRVVSESGTTWSYKITKSGLTAVGNLP
jgi:hypothetical protein